MEKKSVLIWLSFLFAPISVLARDVHFSPTMNPLGNLAEGIGKLFGYLLMDPGAELNILLVKSILFIVLLVMLYSVARAMPFLKDSRLVAWIVSLGISILGIRFLAPSTIEAIMLPYSTVAVALTTFLPILFFTYFVQKVRFQAIRRIMWAFFTVVLLGLWYIRLEQIGDAAWLYAVGAIAAGILLWFDGTIHRAWLKMKIGKDAAESLGAEAAGLQAHMDLLIARYGAARSEAVRKKIGKEMDAVKKRLLDVKVRAGA